MRHAKLSTLALTLVTLSLPAPGQAQVAEDAAWDSVASILRTTAGTAAGYRRYSMPRRDLQLRVGDVQLATGMALGAWAGLSGSPSEATMMGDLVLTQEELGPVLAELSNRGISVTAIHNHLVGAEPQIAYVHFHEAGGAVDLARRLASAVGLTGTPLPVAAIAPPPVSIDTASVFRVLGQRGSAQGPVAQISFNLVPGTVMVHGQAVVPALGYGTPINIQALDGGRAVATGDFAVLGERVDPVLDAFAAHGITATAVHSHLIAESPTVYYIHFWADDSLADVLSGLRAALDAAR